MYCWPKTGCSALRGKIELKHLKKTVILTEMKADYN